MPDNSPRYGVFLSASTEIMSLEDLDVFSSSLRRVNHPVDA